MQVLVCINEMSSHVLIIPAVNMYFCLRFRLLFLTAIEILIFLFSKMNFTYMKGKHTYITACIAAAFFSVQVYAQKTDTVLITASQVNTAFLKEGTHRYIIYFKMTRDATRTQAQFWTRNIERTEYNGRPAIIINQVWEDKDSIMHTAKSVCDAETMQPLLHEVWWKQRGSSSYDFINKTATINGYQLNEADTSKARQRAWGGFKTALAEYELNWHLDLEVFAVLPYKENTTFLIPYYEPGFTAPENIAYTVTGSARLSGYDNQEIDCWLLSHEEEGNKEIFWISKKTNEVLKLEQEINGKIFRYKIKLPYSM